MIKTSEFKKLCPAYCAQGLMVGIDIVSIKMMNDSDSKDTVIVSKGYS